MGIVRRIGTRHRWIGIRIHIRGIWILLMRWRGTVGRGKTVLSWIVGRIMRWVGWRFTWIFFWV
jgi:hypothetical protein